MPRIAKAYIALIIASGTTVLLLAAGSWSSGTLRQFAIYLGLAAVASTLKIRIPGIESTLSPNFVFLLLGMAFCRFSEIATISLAAALVQSLWAAKQARLVQVTFSAATLILSASVAYQASHFLLGRSAVDSPVTLVILAGSLYLDSWNLRKCVLHGLEQLLARERLWEKKAICRFPKNLSRGWLIRCR